MRSVFKPLVTYFRKILEKLRKFSLRTPEIKKKISLKHPRIKKKNKKKIGSNAKNLRNLEPQPEQTFLIKKNECMVGRLPSLGRSPSNYNLQSLKSCWIGSEPDL